MIEGEIEVTTMDLLGMLSTVLSDEAYLDIENFSNHPNRLENPSKRVQQMPSRRDSLYIVVPVTIIYVSIFVTGLIGNISTCIVIARNKSMHTATNYYLFSLAVSDLLLLVSGLPGEIYFVWCKYCYIFGENFCILRGLAAETSTNASVLTITAFTIERYVAICHPFLAHTMSKLSRVVKLILIVWLVALSFALPQALQFGIVEYEIDPTMVMCTLKRTLVRYSFQLSTIFFLVVPMSLITVLYILIGLKLKKSNMMKRRPGREEGGSCKHHPGRSSRRVVKMLVAVVIAFFVCWAPFHVQRLVYIYGTKPDRISSNSIWIENFHLLMTYISGVFYYVSTTINPILYNIMSNKFRVAFMETLWKGCRLPGLTLRNGQRSYSSLSKSQPRMMGTYSSRTAATAGTALPHESTDCSGNSGRDEGPKQTTSLMEQAATKAQETEKKLTESNGRKIKDTKIVDDVRNKGSFRDLKNEDSRRPVPTKYTTVKVSHVDGSGKKWWRLLKWYPGLESLKLARRTTYTVPENRILENNELRREEFSMTMCNVHEANDERPT